MPGIKTAFASLVLITAFASTGLAQIADFLDAARADDVPKLQKLLSDAKLVNARGPHARTALHEAAVNCRVNATRFLVDHGAERQAMDDAAATPADLAAQCPPNVRPYFQILLQTARESSPISLESALAHRQTQVVAMLVSLGFNANALGAGGDRPLNLAATAGDPASLKILLEHGADPNLASGSGYAPLHDAAMHGDAECVNLLLAHGARINALTADDGSTALQLAASLDRLGAVQTLVQHGADVTLKNVKGLTAAELATRNKFTDISAYLASAAAAH